MKKAKKGRFSPKQDRQADHIAEGYQAKGMPASKAKSAGYATINKKKGKRGA